MIKKFATMISFFIVFLSISYIENSYGQNNTTNLDTGNELLNEGKYDEAIVYYDKALEIKPNDVDALNNKGLALYNLERYEEAITYYEKALEIDPKLCRWFI